MAREMKDSGIEWIGKIPVHWNTHRISSYFSERKNKNLSCTETNLLSLSYGKIIRKDINTNGGLLPVSFSTYNIVEPLDIIIRPTDLQNDKKSLRTGLSHEHGIITSAYITLAPKKTVNPKYFHYLLHTYDIEKVFYNMGNGVRQGLNYNEFAKLLVIEPLFAEQRLIANFLDSKCSEIDSVVDDITKEIELLKEYRKSVIYEAVTKGLDPNVEMKDSGIEWVGKIPVHWNIHRISSYFSERKNKNLACAETNLLSLSYGNIIRKDINTNGGLLPASFSTYNIVEPLDIIIRPTDLQNDKKSLRTGLSHEHGIITSAYITLTPKSKVNSEYFHYLLHSYDIEKVFYNMGNGVRQGLNYSEFAKLLVIEPPFAEQTKIVSSLKESCSEIDSSIASKQEQIDTLKEYKKSLIYEYVTGKKEVPAV